MEPHDRRQALATLADDLSWLETHARTEPDLAPRAGELRLAAALVRNVLAPAAEKQPATPLHIAVVGGAGAGKSTVANLLAGAVVAEANPQAGYTRHPTAYLPPGAVLPSSLGFLGPLRRLSLEQPANLDDDVYQARTRVVPADDPLADVVLWDCPDMTTWAAGNYVSRLIEVAGLADLLVYVASDERYNDAVPTEFLHMLVRAGKPVVVVLTKMREADAEKLVAHVRAEVLEKFTSGAAIPPVPIVAIPHLPASDRSDPAKWMKHRAALVNQIQVLMPDAVAARQRTVANAAAYLQAATESLLSVATKDLRELDAWRGAVQAGKATFHDRYRREYLSGEPFRRFDRSRDQALALLELPAGARYASVAFTVLRMPYEYVRGLLMKLASRPTPPELPEGLVLGGAYTGWTDGLQAEALRRAGTHPIWKLIATGFDGHLKPQADERFRGASRAFELKEADDLETAAAGIPKSLENKPVLLGGLRGAKFLFDAAAVAFVIYYSWPPAWTLLLFIPLAAALTHQLVELVVRLWVDGVRQSARARRETLLAEQVTEPLAQ
jgi:hypothetical protein